MPRTLINAWPLFFGLAMIMIGNGLQGTLLGLRATSEGFGVTVTGLIMSMYFGGYLLGSLAAPKLVTSVGHIRVFAALASLASATVLLQAVFVYPLTWMIVRFITGLSYAGLYVVIESWLNGMATNKVRGKIFSIYIIINYLGLMIGQLLINVASPEGFELFILASILVSLALLPISLSNRPAPRMEEPEHIGFKALYKASPLGLAGACLSGITGGTLMTMAPVYAVKAGLSVPAVSVFMTIMLLGALLAQYPIGFLSDRIDRRKIIVICTFTASILSLACYFTAHGNFYVFMAAAFIFWAFGAPLYSLSAAHMNDHLKPAQIVSASGSMILFNGVGACFGPLLVAIFMGWLGNDMFFPALGGIFFFISLFAITRTFMRESVPMEDQGSFVAMPSPARSSPIVAQIAENAIVPESSDINEDTNKN